MSQIGLIPFYRAADTNGNPYADARLYTFLTGTLTPQAVYTTEALDVSHGAYVQADANGLFPAFYPDPAKTYRYQLRIAPYSAAVSGYDVDPVAGQSTVSTIFRNLGSHASGGDRIDTSGAVAAGDGGAASYTVDLVQTSMSTRGIELRDADISNNGTASVDATSRVIAMEVRFRRADASGRYFSLLRSEGVKPLKIPGDTSTTLFQAALDLRSIWGMDPFKIETGDYTITNSLFVTRGLNHFYQGVLQGSGRSFAGLSYFGGTIIRSTMTDRPAVIHQGGRYNEVRDINFVGPLNDFLEAKDYCNPGVTPPADDTDAANWNDGYPVGQYNVLCCIAVDPYSTQTVAPGSPYPSITDPSWAGPATYYGRSLTWGNLTERVNIQGYPAAFACHPCPDERQGDMTRFRDFDISNCIYGVSIGNTQSRNVEIRNGQIRKTFCAITNRIFGEQHGLLGGPIDNVCIYNCTKFFDLQTSTSGPIVFRDTYGEAIWMLGEVRNGATVSQPIAFDGCDVRFDHITNNRGAPYAVLRDPTVKDSGYSASPVQMTNCNFVADWVIALDVQQVSITETRVWILAITNAGSGYPALTAARAMAHNGTAGVVTALFRPSAPCNIGYNICDIDALTASVQQWTGDISASLTSRKYCIPYHVERAKPRLETSARAAVRMPCFNTVPSLAKNAGSLTVWSVSGHTVTFTNASSAATAAQNAMRTGRVVKDSTSGAFFFITAYNTATGATTMEALTGFYYDEGTAAYKLRETFDPLTGTLFFCETGFYTPSYILLGDVTAASDTVTNLRNASGDTAWLTGEIVDGDYLWVDPDDPAPPFTAGAASKVVTFNAGAQTMKMGAAAAVGTTQVGRRFELFLRMI